MLEPSEEAAARAQKKAADAAVAEHTSDKPLKEKLASGGGVITPSGPSNPRLEEADRKANAPAPKTYNYGS